jgi:hypothetical protein
MTDPTYGFAKIVNEEIVICIPIATLPLAMEGACDLKTIDPPCRVTNPSAFAKDFVRALNDESEDGTTPIHRLFDAAMNAALENGATGVEDVPQPDTPL